MDPYRTPPDPLRFGYFTPARRPFVRTWWGALVAWLLADL